MFAHLKIFLIACLLLFSMAYISCLQALIPQNLQKQADGLREKNKSLEAIDLYNEAIVQYQEDQDYVPMLEALTGRLLSWKHLYYKTNDKIYAIFVKKEAEAMLEIVKLHCLQDKLYLIHFLNASSAILLNDYLSAEKEFREAVELYPYNNAEKGNWIARLGDAMYRNGKKKEGQQTLLQGVQRIQEKAAETDSFLVNVWISGAYLRLAKLLQFDHVEESHFYLNQSKKIIDSDERLVIRKQQLEAFMKGL